MPADPDIRLRGIVNSSIPKRTLLRCWPPAVRWLLTGFSLISLPTRSWRGPSFVTTTTGCFSLVSSLVQVVTEFSGPLKFKALTLIAFLMICLLTGDPSIPMTDVGTLVTSGLVVVVLTERCVSSRNIWVFPDDPAVPVRTGAPAIRERVPDANHRELRVINPHQPLVISRRL